MVILLVCLALKMCFVHGNVSNSNCTSYKQINKENIRNCLEVNHENEPLNVAPEKPEKSEVILHELKSSELSENLNTYFSNSSSMARKMKMSMNMMQYLLVPGLLMAGILPWIMPGLQMAVSMLSMVNNMAFTTALVAMIRSYVFDKESDEHVVYINHGYKNKNMAGDF